MKVLYCLSTQEKVDSFTLECTIGSQHNPRDLSTSKWRENYDSLGYTFLAKEIFIYLKKWNERLPLEEQT